MCQYSNCLSLSHRRDETGSEALFRGKSVYLMVPGANFAIDNTSSSAHIPSALMRLVVQPRTQRMLSSQSDWAWQKQSIIQISGSIAWTVCLLGVRFAVRTNQDCHSLRPNVGNREDGCSRRVAWCHNDHQRTTSTARRVELSSRRLE